MPSQFLEQRSPQCVPCCLDKQRTEGHYLENRARSIPSEQGTHHATTGSSANDPCLSCCPLGLQWLTYHSTSPLLPRLRGTSLPSGTDLQGMPLDTCHPGPGWHGSKTSHNHHEQSQTPSSLSPGLFCSQPPNLRLSHRSASQGHASLTQCKGSGHSCSRIHFSE